MENKGISVVICCFNSAKRLPETIRHIALQKINIEVNWELIIIDNNSSDQTYQIAQNEINRFDSLKDRSKIVQERNPGLSNARNKGVDEAYYEFIIFCDDDNWLNADYLEIAYKTLTLYPKVGALGGKSIGISDSNFPDWWKNYAFGYAVGKQSEQSGILTNKKFLWGAGLVFRRSLYLTAFIPSKNYQSDRTYDELISGGDYEICLRMLLMGYSLYYSDNLKFKHFIEKHRLTRAYRDKLFLSFSTPSPQLGAMAQYIDLLSYTNYKKLQRLFRSILKTLIYFAFKKNRDFINYDANAIFFLTGIKTRMCSENIEEIVKLRKFYMNNI